MDHVSAIKEREDAWDRFLTAVGSCRTEDGASDVATRHDEYLSDALLVKVAPALRSGAILGRREAPSIP